MNLGGNDRSVDPPATTRRKRHVWLAIIITAVAFVVAILTSRWRRQWLPRLLPRRRLVAFPPPIRIQGLTEAEAEARRLEGQDNTIHLKPPRARREIWRENVYNIFNLNLVGLALVQFLLSRPLDALLSLGTMCLNIGLQVAREMAARRRLEEIEQATRARATVTREERARSIDPSEIVLGDVLVVGPGDLLWVDGEVLGDGEMVLDESRFTGQSHHITRRAGDKVYVGSLCISGRAAYEPQRVGSKRKIASTTREGQAAKDELTVLERTVDRILRVLLLIVGISAGLLLAIYFGLDTGISEEVFTRYAALIFNVAPSSLFFMIVLTYTAGTARLAKLGALVHRARSVESLAQATVICFSEAGILTGTHVDVEPIEVPEDQERVAESRIHHILGDYAFSTAIDNLATRAMRRSFEGSQRPVLQEAPFLAVYGWSAVAFDDEDLRGVYVLGEQQVLDAHFTNTREQQVPGQEARAPLAALQRTVAPVSRLFQRRDPTSQGEDSLGEPQGRSSADAIPAGPPPDSLEAKEAADGDAMLENLMPSDEDQPSSEDAPSNEGGTEPHLLRCILSGVNRRLRRRDEKVEQGEVADAQAAQAVTLLFACDPDATQLYVLRGEPCLPPGLRPLCRLRYVERVRPEAVHTIQAFAETGVSIKVFTSDAPEQTEAALREAGLGSGKDLPLPTVFGPQLAELGAAQFSRAAEEHTVFGQLSSAQAGRLVRALREAGQSVAVVGDRANDLAAMEQASLAIARRSSTQAAVRMADIVLLEDSPGVLTEVLDKGQRIANGVLDVLKLYLTQVSYLALLMTACILAAIGLPLTSVQSSMIVIFTVTIPSVGLSVLAASGVLPTARLNRLLARFSIPAAITMATAALGVYMYFLAATDDRTYAQLLVTNLLVICGLLLVVFVRPPLLPRVRGEPPTGDWRSTALVLVLWLLFLGVSAIPLAQEYLRLGWMRQPSDWLVLGLVAICWALVLRLIWWLTPLWHQG